MIKCSNCGSEILEIARFCKNCGAEIEDVDQKKPSTNTWILIFFIALGSYYGVLAVIDLTTGANDQFLGGLFWTVLSFIIAWGIYQRRRWGRILGLVYTIFLALLTGRMFFIYSNLYSKYKGTPDDMLLLITTIVAVIFAAMSIIVAKKLYDIKDFK